MDSSVVLFERRGETIVLNKIFKGISMTFHYV